MGVGVGVGVWVWVWVCVCVCVCDTAPERWSSRTPQIFLTQAALIVFDLNHSFRSCVSRTLVCSQTIPPCLVYLAESWLEP